MNCSLCRLHRLQLTKKFIAELCSPFALSCPILLDILCVPTHFAHRICHDKFNMTLINPLMCIGNSRSKLYQTRTHFQSSLYPELNFGFYITYTRSTTYIVLPLESIKNMKIKIRPLGLNNIKGHQSDLLINLQPAFNF